MGKYNYKPLIVKAFVIVTSGLCWYFSNGLTGDFWYLVWLAPVPVLLFSFQSTAKNAFFVSFLSSLIGRLSWFSYLVTVAGLVPSIVFTIALSLAFALIVVLSRATVRKLPSWISLSAFPVYMTTFEFLLFKFSPDGTASSMAYSQSDVLWIIQIAAVTGITGITFLITLFPSAITLAWMNLSRKKNLVLISVFTGAIMIPAILFGIIRINSPFKVRSVTAGLVVLDERDHTVNKNFDPQKEKEVVNHYAGEVARLAKQGANLIVLPERAINMNKALQREFTDVLIHVAKENHILLIAGYSNYTGEKDRNSALIIGPHGDILANYNKIHLVTGLEDQFISGNEPAIFESEQIKLGTAICKDLDFPDFIRTYGKKDMDLLGIPAWDFVVDSWLHSRMAVLRGVENGFSEVRAARQGFLTISDCFGRVTCQADCSDGKKVSVTGAVKLSRKQTIFSRYGNWFGYLNLLSALSFIGLLFIKKKNHTNHP